MIATFGSIAHLSVYLAYAGKIPAQRYGRRKRAIAVVRPERSIVMIVGLAMMR